MPFLPYGRQHIDDDDIAAVVSVLRSDWLTTGPVVDTFEMAFAEKVGAKYAVACNSGTAGLHIAMMALGLGPGDVAIVPTMTFLATANAARYVGAEVEFADVNAETGLMDEESLRSAILRSGGRAKAILPVHLNGQCVDMPMIAQIAAEYGMAVVEDACHALGTSYKSNGVNIQVGSCQHSDIAVYSLHPVKTITMGEGGMVTTNDPEMYERMSRFRTHGMVRASEAFKNETLAFGSNGEPNPWYYEMPEPGYNYRASEINCALGLSQLAKLDFFIERRQELAALYDGALTSLAPLIKPVPRVPETSAALHLYVVHIDFAALGMERGSFMRKLTEMGIGTQVHYLPVHLQPYYQERYGQSSFTGAQSYYDRCLSLPLFPTMENTDVERVVSALSGILNETDA